MTLEEEQKKHDIMMFLSKAIEGKISLLDAKVPVGEHEITEILTNLKKACKTIIEIKQKKKVPDTLVNNQNTTLNGILKAIKELEDSEKYDDIEKLQNIKEKINTYLKLSDIIVKKFRRAA